MSLDNEKRFNNTILNKPSPFVKTRYLKGSKIDVFVGREQELKLIIEKMKEIAQTRVGTAIKISGPGGSGKSTLFGYLCQLIDTGEIYQNEDFKISEKDFLFKSAFIDAPKDIKTSYKYIWSQIVDSMQDTFGEVNGTFFDHIGTKFIVKALKIIYEKNPDKTIIDILSNLIHDFPNRIKDHPWDSLVKPEDLIKNESIYKSKNLEPIKKIILNNARLLMRQSEDLSKINEKRNFRYEEKYVNTLLEVFDENFSLGSKAADKLKGIDSSYLESDQEIMRIFKWFIDTWEWIEKKPIGFVVGIDNIGYLTVESTDHESVYIPFIQTLLQIRNDMKNFLFIIIGTTDDWSSFENYIHDKALDGQLKGLISKNMDLDRLTKLQAVDALKLLMQKFWTSVKLNPNPMEYPFSAEFFRYLYDFESHDFRSVLNDLNEIWNSFRSQNVVKEFNDSFEMIRYIRQEWQYSALKEVFAPDRLLPFEIDALNFKWNDIKSTFASRDRSLLTENALEYFINVLRQNEEPRQISLVQTKAEFEFIKDGERKKTKPDVFVQIFNRGTIDETRGFEIQVKIHGDTMVSLGEIQSSLDSLEYHKIDALLFLIIGPGLEKRAIEYIYAKELQSKIFCVNPLNKSQIDTVLFMVYYQQIMGGEPPLDIVKITLNKIFGINWNELVSRIENMVGLSGLGSTIGAKDLSIAEPTSPPIIEPMTPPIVESIVSLNGDGKLDGKPDVKIPISPISDTKEEKIPEKLGNVVKRYEKIQKEVYAILQIALERNDRRYKGSVTKAFLKKNTPAHLQEEQVSKVFDQLKKDATRDWDLLAKYEGTSLNITDLGKEYYYYFNGMKNQH